MKIIQLNPTDNVVVAIHAFAKNDSFVFDNQTITLIDDIPAGHKIAICPIQTGEAVVKYGFPIGWATKDISSGQHVHLHNLKSE
ncbi:hypothetical protein FACS189413_02880 [Bacteroidia bacterium]|nr:hypothetical protein FACS189413_02880 [Bacteroidia bacterium]